MEKTNKELYDYAWECGQLDLLEILIKKGYCYCQETKKCFICQELDKIKEKSFKKHKREWFIELEKLANGYIIVSNQYNYILTEKDFIKIKKQINSF